MVALHGYEQAIQHMEHALKHNVNDVESFKCAYGFTANLPMTVTKNAVPHGLPVIKEYHSSMGEYGKLMEGVYAILKVVHFSGNFYLKKGPLF